MRRALTTSKPEPLDLLDDLIEPHALEIIRVEGRRREQEVETSVIVHRRLRPVSVGRCRPEVKLRHCLKFMPTEGATSVGGIRQTAAIEKIFDQKLGRFVAM